MRSPDRGDYQEFLNYDYKSAAWDVRAGKRTGPEAVAGSAVRLGSGYGRQRAAGAPGTRPAACSARGGNPTSLYTVTAPPRRHSARMTSRSRRGSAQTPWLLGQLARAPRTYAPTLALCRALVSTHAHLSDCASSLPSCSDTCLSRSVRSGHTRHVPLHMQVALLPDNHTRDRGRAGVVEDLVVHGLHHLEARSRGNRVHEHIPVDPDSVF